MTCLQYRHVINLHKLLVLPVYLGILAYFGTLDNVLEQDYGPAAALLLVGHGFYGWAWIFKDIYFPNKAFKASIKLADALFFFFIQLGVYYSPMFCLVSDDKCPLGSFGQGNETVLLALGCLCYTAGMFFEFCSDLQTYIMLNTQQQKKTLITNIFFKYTRNPNYFGEVLLYLGYTLWSTSYLVLCIMVAEWILVFVPRMNMKDKSLSRYPGFDEWKQKTGLIVPRVLPMISDFVKYSFGTPPEEMKKA